jgi:hypothetical protein
MKVLGWLYVKLLRGQSVSESEQAQHDATVGEDLAEGYPTLARVLRGVLNDDRVPDVGVRRIEINTFASGDATYNVWLLGHDEPEGGYLDEL